MPSPYQNWSQGPTALQEGQEVQSHMWPEGEEPEMFDAQTCDYHLPQEWSQTYPVSVSITWEDMWPQTGGNPRQILEQYQARL